MKRVRPAKAGTVGVARRRRSSAPAVPTGRKAVPRAAVLARARRVLAIEAGAIAAMADRLDADFARAVERIATSRGKVVVTGMGKSGHVCRKIAATLASTGTPATFLHAAEALHGDLGVLAREDLVLAVSNSGDTPEIVALIPVLKRLGIPLVALTGNPTSTLAAAADAVLDASVAEEACPLGLAPTASTTAALALGDALAVALLEERGFRPEDFAALHPAGALGRKLLRVADLMHVGEALPLVTRTTPMRETLLEITSRRLGLTGVVGDDGRLAGVITDGDLRRALARTRDLLEATARTVMSAEPKTIKGDSLAAEAVAVMERHSITALFVVDADHRPIGVIHLHDLLRAGVV